MRCRRARSTGFTLVELVLVIALLAIVASIGVGRLTDDTPLKARRFGTDAANALSAAQRLAVAQRRTVHVSLDAAARTVTLCLDAGCATPIAPAPDLSAVLALPSGLQFSASASSVSFDSSGRPSNGATLTLRVLDSAGNDLAMVVTLEPETGYVRFQAG